MHGGEIGFGKYVWKVLGTGGGKTSYVKLGHRSPAGINGFPGNLDVTALITVYENTLTLQYEATTDASDADQLYLASLFHARRAIRACPSTTGR